MVLSHLSQYYISLINKLRHAPAEQRTLTPSTHHIISTTGTLVYHVERRGFFGLITNDGEQYCLYNSKDFLRQLQDRSRFRFTLEYYPNVANYYQWGIISRLINIKRLKR